MTTGVSMPRISATLYAVLTLSAQAQFKFPK